MTKPALSGTIAALILSAATLLPAVFAAAPAPLKDVAPVGDLAREAADQHAVLAGLLKSKESFEEEGNRKKRIPRAAGVIAVMGQAIAEHPDKAKTKIKGADLRAAARGVITAKTFEEATAAFALIQPALDGTSDGKTETDYAWNKLMSLHRLMEEVEAHHEKLRDVAFPRTNAVKPEEGAQHASTLAVLALVMHVDTHEVKKPEEIPEYQSYAKEFGKVCVDLSAAIRKGDAATVKGLYPKTTDLCGNCHDKFRK